MFATTSYPKKFSRFILAPALCFSLIVSPFSKSLAEEDEDFFSDSVSESDFEQTAVEPSFAPEPVVKNKMEEPKKVEPPVAPQIEPSKSATSDLSSSERTPSSSNFPAAPAPQPVVQPEPSFTESAIPEKSPIVESVSIESAAPEVKPEITPSEEPVPAKKSKSVKADVVESKPAVVENQVAVKEKSKNIVTRLPAKKVSGGFKTTKKNCAMMSYPDSDSEPSVIVPPGRKIWTEEAGTEWVKAYNRNGDPIFLNLGCF